VESRKRADGTRRVVVPATGVRASVVVGRKEQVAVTGSTDGNIHIDERKWPRREALERAAEKRTYLPQ